GWPIASLITGRPEFSFNSNQTIDPALRFFSNAFFAQDDITVTPKLTVNLGIQYDYGRPKEQARRACGVLCRDRRDPAARGRQVDTGELSSEQLARVDCRLHTSDW